MFYPKGKYNVKESRENFSKCLLLIYMYQEKYKPWSEAKVINFYVTPPPPLWNILINPKYWQVNKRIWKCINMIEAHSSLLPISWAKFYYSTSSFIHFPQVGRAWSHYGCLPYCANLEDLPVPPVLLGDSRFGSASPCLTVSCEDLTANWYGQYLNFSMQWLNGFIRAHHYRM